MEKSILTYLKTRKSNLRNIQIIREKENEGEIKINFYNKTQLYFKIVKNSESWEVIYSLIYSSKVDAFGVYIFTCEAKSLVEITEGIKAIIETHDLKTNRLMHIDGEEGVIYEK